MGTDWISRFETLLIDSRWPRPDTVIVDDDTWFTISSRTSTSVPHNSIFRCRLPDAGADAAIDRVLAPYHARRSQIRWVITPTSTPPDLGDRLAVRGFVRQPVGLCMVAPRTFDPGQVGSGVEVFRIDLDMVDTYVETLARAWGDIADEHLATIAEDCRRYLSEGRADIVQFMATVDGRPAGVGVLRLIAGFGLLQGSAVIPEHRRRGAYRALLAARLTDMRAHGADQAAIIANPETSGAICKRLGFREVTRFEYYIFDPDDAGSTGRRSV